MTEGNSCSPQGMITQFIPRDQVLDFRRAYSCDKQGAINFMVYSKPSDPGSLRVDPLKIGGSRMEFSPNFVHTWTLLKNS